MNPPLRVLSAVFALALLASVTVPIAYVAAVEYSSCFGVNDHYSCSDPEYEAQLKAQAMTPEEARSVGCAPIYIGDDKPPAQPPAEVLYLPEDEPTAPPRTVDPALSARVNGAWERIERWLGAHASATLRALKHPVDFGLITRWEKDARLPDDLYASLLRHDGAEGNLGKGFQLPPDIGLADLSSSLNWSNCLELVLDGSMDKANTEDGLWHGSLIPFGSNGHGDELFVDPRTGRVGDKRNQEHIDYSRGWPSFVAMLEAVAASLEGGTPLRDRYPSVTAGCELRWAKEKPGPPPANCAGPPRPSPTPTPTPEPPKPLTAAQKAERGCAPPSRKPPVVKYPPVKVQAEVDRAWRRIERWLARKAPKTLRTLNPPADAREIARAERAIGQSFPDDLRASLLRHNGVKDWGFSFVPFYEPASVREIQREWTMMCGIITKAGWEYMPDWWHGRVIPFAPTNDGGHLYIDSATGTVGDYYNEDGLSPDEYPSYLDLLRQTARDLEKGKSAGGWVVKVVKGELDWDFKRS
ncbi:SMI1/KNR4 family protein [Nonomuraea typhae]|uniref:SMI1/KNR4 family protein n=1 Tax=Nonomuraea typhae TaxID=2603600 RepID=UPI0012F837D9|nr:SMI1/KNR4 family protein [Nonomuraea typhae]